MLLLLEITMLGEVCDGLLRWMKRELFVAYPRPRTEKRKKNKLYTGEKFNREEEPLAAVD
jgi:hypothetical protein